MKKKKITPMWRRVWFALLLAAALITAVSQLGSAGTSRPFRYYTDSGNTAFTYYTNASGNINDSYWGINTDNPTCELSINGTACINRTGFYYNGVNITSSTYFAGNGLTLGSFTFSTNAQTANSTQASAWNGSAWLLRNLSSGGGGTTYSAGKGLNLTGTTFDINAPVTNASQALSWNGSAFNITNAVNGAQGPQGNTGSTGSTGATGPGGANGSNASITITTNGSASVVITNATAGAWNFQFQNATTLQDGFATSTQITSLNAKALAGNCVGSNSTHVNVTMNATTAGPQCIAVALNPGGGSGGVTLSGIASQPLHFISSSSAASWLVNQTDINFTNSAVSGYCVTAGANGQFSYANCSNQTVVSYVYTDYALAGISMGLATTWVAQPAAVTECFGDTKDRIKVNLTGSSLVRLVTRVNAGGAATSNMSLQYSTDESSWNGLTSSVLIDSTGVKNSSWNNLSGSQLGDVYVRCVGQNGNAIANPDVPQVHLQVMTMISAGGSGSGGSTFDPSGLYNNVTTLQTNITNTNIGVNTINASLNRTVRKSVLLGATMPDTSGNVWFEPASNTQTNKLYPQLVARFKDTTTNDTLGLQFTVPDDYSPNSAPHLWIVWTTTATVGNVTLGLKYNSAALTATLDPVSSEENLTLTNTVSATSQNGIASSFNLTATNLAANDLMQMALSRNGNTTTDNTAADIVAYDVIFEYNTR